MSSTNFTTTDSAALVRLHVMRLKKCLLQREQSAPAAAAAAAVAAEKKKVRGNQSASLESPKDSPLAVSYCHGFEGAYPAALFDFARG